MTIFVDHLADRGWKMHGRKVKSCHLVSDQVDLRELHAFAERLGMSLAWFQAKPGRPHYDLTAKRREAAVAAGAIECSSRQLIIILRDRQVAADRMQAWRVAATAYVAGARAAGINMADPLVRVATDDAAECYASYLVGNPLA